MLAILGPKSSGRSSLILVFGLTFVLGCKLSDNRIIGHIGESNEEIPENPANLGITLITDKTVSFSWVGPQSTGGYRLALVAGSVPPVTCDSGALYEADEPAINLQGLSEDQLYSFRVCTLSPSKTLTSSGIVGSFSTLTFCGSPGRLVNSPYANSGEPNIDGGSSSSAYGICTEQQLYNLSQTIADWGKNFQLKADLDMSKLTVSYSPIGTAANNFVGNFDGNFFRVKNLKIDNPAQWQGLFGQVGTGGVVKNLGVTNASLRVGGDSGIVIGVVRSGAVARNLYSQGSITALGRGTGGIVGNIMASGTVENVYSAIEIFASGALNNQKGGVVGTLGGTLRNCYATGNIKSPDNDRIGGIVGSFSFDSTLENCFSAVNVEGFKDIFDHVGRICGYCSGTAINNFYDSQNLCVNSGSGACQGYNGTQIDTISSPNYFFGNLANPPMDAWPTGEFESYVDGYPVLANQGGPPASSQCWYKNRQKMLPYANFGEPGIDGSSQALSYLICNAGQLNSLGPRSADYGKYFSLGDQVNLGHLMNAEYNIIGSSITRFAGEFDGGGLSIYNFNYASNVATRVGLFGDTDFGSVINDLHLVNVNVTGGVMLEP